MITVPDLLNHYPCRLLAGVPDTERAVSGGYACDMLSWVMSRLDTGDVWLTILNSINVIAVASLADCACVLLTEGVVMDREILDKANEKNLVILGTDLPTYEAAVSLNQILQTDL